ncbi:MAG: AAA domain-containing protein [Methanomethylophilus sp.]|jgi:very-short-patch-repair endonuclease
MKGIEENLYNDLVQLREKLREEHTNGNGRAPQICSDEALLEMARRIPTKPEDLAAIDGIGQRFVETYGDDFLSVTRRYAVTAAHGAKLDKDVAMTLRELQKKLVNVSKGNRLLYMPRTSVKTSVDLTLTVTSSNIMDFIFGKLNKVQVCDKTFGKEDAKAYTRVNNIFREVNREVRERGTNDLYVAYPFCEGKLEGDDEFLIRAPLALIPVKAERHPNTFSIVYDDTRDPIYNTTLMLAVMKATRHNKMLPDSAIENLDRSTFISDLLTYYAEAGVELTCDRKRSTLEQFAEYRAGEFPDYEEGELKVTYNAVLGIYPSYSNFIQRDFDEMLSGKEINSTLADLIRDLNKEDYFADGPAPLSDADLQKEGIETSEKALTYINKLNSAQENVLTAIQKKDEIVVEGPPGTGKSQVITGLICSAAIQGKTVLMVSEKKTALDVVYSRLGSLSRFCLQIDDTSDKDRFYKQLATMMQIRPLAIPKGTDDISERIDQDMAKLTEIAQDLYTPDDFGIAPVRLYGMDPWLNSGDRSQYETYKIYEKDVSPSLLNEKYDSVKALHSKFAYPTLVSNYREYFEIVEKSPWMNIMKQDLSGFDIAEMRSDLERLDGEVADLNKKGFLSRLFSKGKVTRDATAVVNKYFQNYDSKTIENVMADPMKVAGAMDDYETFENRSTVYHDLTVPEREYGKDLLSVSKDLHLPDSEANDGIYKYLLNKRLQTYDSTHRQILQMLHDFDGIISDIDYRMEQKRAATRKILEAKLADSLRVMNESKRRGDIARIIDNKRKWSLNKFIGRYSYELFGAVKIWLLTPEVVSEIIPLDMGLFDLLVFDEASQMYVERGVPSIYRAKKVVVAGDHKQLRPSSLGTGRITYEEDEDADESEDVEVNSALEEESLLDIARARYDSILLNFHYRSRYEELIAFSNYVFYGGRLYVSPNMEVPDRPPIEVIKVDGVWKDRSNEAEADKIVELLKRFSVERKNRETVGIITFNVSQRDLINDKLEDACAKDPEFDTWVAEESRRYENGEDVGLFVKNIESVQGDERDVIIFSIGYAKDPDGKFRQRFGWLNARGGENRLNVAVSRAKRKVIIVSSIEPEELQTDNLESEGPKILKSYLQYARAISNGNRNEAQAILRSYTPPDLHEEEEEEQAKIPVIDRVYDTLIRKGYTVERNVGIGGYTIDLAVKQDGRYILGIESDTRIYSMGAGTRERDYHRQKYLESRGWHIHRVWTPGMWKDPELEIAKIVEAIEKAQSGTA